MRGTLVPPKRRSLQSQGVPFGDRLKGPSHRSHTVRTNSTTPDGSNVSTSTTYGGQRRSRKSTAAKLSAYNPATAGTNASGVGTLEAEFLVALALLILLMFSSDAAYSDKIMSTMKRGTLVCILFFVLALVAGAGPNAAKGAKAFGALTIVGILLTSPVSTIFNDLDNLIKNDWKGSSETEGGGSAASADTGTNTGTSGVAGDAISGAQSAVSNEGQKATGNPFSTNVKESASATKQDIGNAAVALLNGIIPGSGDAVGKLFGL